MTVVVARGGACTVECAIRPSGATPAKDFLEIDLEQIREKGKNNPEATARTRFMMLFQEMANSGRLQSERFKKEMGNLWAFRREVKNLQIRFPCFQDGRRWILTHGFIKKAKRGKGVWPQNEVARAETIMAEYFRLKQQTSQGL